MDLLNTVNDQQKKAIETTEGPVLIVAGAGTGKTMALTYRMAYLIQEKGIDPRQILAVTFTNKAAGEMKERVKQLISESDVMAGTVPTMGTFHSICVQILRREIQHLGYESSFVIYDSDDSLALVKRMMKELKISDKQFNPKAIRGAISSAKNILQSVDDVQRSAMNTFQEKVGLVYEYYQKALQKAEALDFDDLIMKTVELFEEYETVLQKYQYRWKYIHVDEYQDTNTAQYKLVHLLAQAFRNLCVVGDPDQNIYSWRGADITNILNFTKEYSEAKVIKLEQNYRSTSFILKAAEEVISQNKSRIEKELWTDKEDGEKIQMIDVDDEKAEADYVLRCVRPYMGQLNNHVVLYRTNAQSRMLEEACLRYGIPYKVIGGLKFYARKEIKDIIAYLRLIYNARDDASFARIINTPTRKIGAKTMEAVQRVAVREIASLYQVASGHVHGLEMELSESKVNQVRSFSDLIGELQAFSKEFPVSTLIREILHRTKYDQMLMMEKDVGQARLENVQELMTVAKKYDELEPGVGLGTFLEEVALVSDTDSLQGSEDYLTLMTVHSAKGLEYQHVYIVGLEEGIFPHSRSAFDPEQMEEERRLMYVAMTRAKEKLHLLWARRRMLYGETQYNPPSSFLKHIPEEVADGEYLAQKGEKEMANRIRSYGREQREKEEVTFSDEIPHFMRNIQVPNHNAQSNIKQIFEEGDSVEHKAFGRGVIRSLKGDIADIDFDHYGMKKIALNVAPVKKL